MSAPVPALFSNTATATVAISVGDMIRALAELTEVGAVTAWVAIAKNAPITRSIVNAQRVM